MQMKRRDGNDWENLYPKTTADNVTMHDGKSVQEKVEDIDQKFPEDIVLWEGSVQLDGDETVNPSKPLSECATGWILVWANAGQFQYQVIPKISLNFVGGAGTRATLAAQGGVMVHKYFYPRDTEITGHASNVRDDNDLILLFRVLEF